MSWRRATGVLAVLIVVGTVLGTVGTLVTTNDLLLGSAQQAAAAVTLLVVLGGLAGFVLTGGPSSKWFGNPYW